MCDMCTKYEQQQEKTQQNYKEIINNPIEQLCPATMSMMCAFIVVHCAFCLLLLFIFSYARSNQLDLFLFRCTYAYMWLWYEPLCSCGKSLICRKIMKRNDIFFKNNTKKISSDSVKL